MSWGINPKAEEKEKIFADFADSLNGMNCADGLSYRHYSEIFDLGRKLADEEYQQGRADAIDEFIAKIEKYIAYSFEHIKYTDLMDIADQLKEQK